jgi:predicted NBD/HSP70 family sugar kinase
VDVPAVARDRHAQIGQLIGEMESVEVIDEGQFNALGMFVTDASLAADEPALQAAQDGLQWLYSQREALSDPDAEQIEQRGRLLGLIDVTHWALRRLPSTLQAGLDLASHAGQFLRAVAEHPGLSNQELALRLGIDETEASRVGRRLLAAGVVWRRKEWRRNAWDITPRGRTYLVNAGLAEDPQEPDLEFAVGVKMLPDRLIGCVIDADAQQLQRDDRELEPAADPADQMDELEDFVRALISQVSHAADADERSPGRIGLGVEVGGHYGPPGAWDDFALHQRLRKVSALPAVIESEAKALAEYEYVYGESREPRSLVAVVLGESIGCGLIADGRLVRGARGMAGELGHLLVQPGGRRCRCGDMGCLESIASTWAIPQVFDELAGRGGPDSSDLATVIAHFEKGDNDAAAALEKAGIALGIAISMILELFNPDKIVLYGPAELVCESGSHSAERFMSHVRESSGEHALSAVAGEYELETKAYDNETGARSAAAVALLRVKGQLS